MRNGGRRGRGKRASHAICCVSTFRSVDAGRLGAGPIALDRLALLMPMYSSLLGMQMRDIKSWGLGSKSHCSPLVGRDKLDKPGERWAVCLLYFWMA